MREILKVHKHDKLTNALQKTEGSKEKTIIKVFTPNTKTNKQTKQSK